MKLNTTINSRRVRGFWGAHASRVLASTSRRDELFSAWSLALRPGLFPTRTKFVAAGRCNQHARRVRSPELAFTLIEILTASLAAALILLAIYGLFQRSVKMRDHATERAHEAQLRGRAERVIRNDLRNAFVSGTDTRMLATTFEGGKQNTNSRFPGYLRFTTTTGKDTATDAYGDVQEVEYSIADSANGGDSHAGTLTRFITRDLLSTTPTTPIAEPLLTRVSSVEVAFFDGQSWQESWQFGTNSPTLPQAIRLRVQREPQSDQSPASPVLEIMEPLIVVAQSFDTTSATGTSSNQPPSQTQTPTPAPTPTPTPPTPIPASRPPRR